MPTSTGEREEDNRFWTDINNKEEETHGKRRHNGLNMDKEEEERREEKRFSALRFFLTRQRKNLASEQ